MEQIDIGQIDGGLVVGGWMGHMCAWGYRQDVVMAYGRGKDAPHAEDGQLLVMSSGRSTSWWHHLQPAMKGGGGHAPGDRVWQQQLKTAGGRAEGGRAQVAGFGSNS